MTSSEIYFLVLFIVWFVVDWLMHSAQRRYFDKVQDHVEGIQSRIVADVNAHRKSMVEFDSSMKHFHSELKAQMAQQRNFYENMTEDILAGRKAEVYDLKTGVILPEDHV